MPNQIEAILRIPTAHQYAYIEIKAKGTPEEVIRQYMSITTLYKAMQSKWDSEEKPPF